VSTILGVAGLALAPSYVFQTFFKMVFLVISLGAAHGLLLLPVLLSLGGRHGGGGGKVSPCERDENGNDVEQTKL